MPTLIETLNRDKTTARYAHNDIESKLLSYIIAEAVKKAMSNPKNPQKSPSEDDIIKTIEKSIEANIENLSIKTLDETHRSEFENENEILKKYLPLKMTEEELRVVIVLFLSENKGSNLGLLMKYLRENYSGKYDGGQASQLAKSLLAG